MSMSRLPVSPAVKKIRIVLSIIAGEVNIVDEARKAKVFVLSIGRWKAEFLEAGKAALIAGKSGRSSRE